MDVRILSVSDRIVELISRGYSVAFSKESGLVLCKVGKIEGVYLINTLYKSGRDLQEALVNAYEVVLDLEEEESGSCLSGDIAPSEQYLDEGDAI